MSCTGNDSAFGRSNHGLLPSRYTYSLYMQLKRAASTPLTKVRLQELLKVLNKLVLRGPRQTTCRADARGSNPRSASWHLAAIDWELASSRRRYVRDCCCWWQAVAPPFHYVSPKQWMLLPTSEGGLRECSSSPHLFIKLLHSATSRLPSLNSTKSRRTELLGEKNVCQRKCLPPGVEKCGRDNLD